MKAKDLLKIADVNELNFDECGIVHEIGELQGFQTVSDHLRFYFGVAPDEEPEIATGDYFWIYRSALSDCLYPEMVIKNADLSIEAEEGDILLLIHLED